MLDIAGGILIAMLSMSALAAGIKLMLWPEPSGRYTFLTGFLLTCAAGVFIIWVIFVHGGLVTCPPDWQTKLPEAVCPS